MRIFYEGTNKRTTIYKIMSEIKHRIRGECHALAFGHVYQQIICLYVFKGKFVHACYINIHIRQLVM